MKRLFGKQAPLFSPDAVNQGFDSAYERGAGAILDRPHAVAAELPVAEHRRDVRPGLGAREWSADVAHHLKVRTDAGIVIKIRFPEFRRFKRSV